MWSLYRAGSAPESQRPKASDSDEARVNQVASSHSPIASRALPGRHRSCTDGVPENRRHTSARPVLHATIGRGTFEALRIRPPLRPCPAKN